MFFHDDDNDDDDNGNQRKLVAERRKRNHQNEYIDKPSRLLVLGDEPVSTNRPKLLRSESARPIFNHCMDCSLSSHSICLHFVHRFSRSCIHSCLNSTLCTRAFTLITSYLVFFLVMLYMDSLIL